MKVPDKLPEVWHSQSKITLATVSRVKSTIHLPSSNQGSIFPQTNILLLANVSSGSSTSCGRQRCQSNQHAQTWLWYRPTRMAPSPQNIKGGVRNFANTPHSVYVGLQGVTRSPQ